MRRILCMRVLWRVLRRRMLLWRRRIRGMLSLLCWRHCARKGGRMCSGRHGWVLLCRRRRRRLRLSRLHAKSPVTTQTDLACPHGGDPSGAYNIELRTPTNASCAYVHNVDWRTSKSHTRGGQAIKVERTRSHASAAACALAGAAVAHPTTPPPPPAACRAGPSHASTCSSSVASRTCVSVWMPSLVSGVSNEASRFLMTWWMRSLAASSPRAAVAVGDIQSSRYCSCAGSTAAAFMHAHGLACLAARRTPRAAPWAPQGTRMARARAGACEASLAGHCRRMNEQWGDAGGPPRPVSSRRAEVRTSSPVGVWPQMMTVGAMSGMTPLAPSIHSARSFAERLPESTTTSRAMPRLVATALTSAGWSEASWRWMWSQPLARSCSATAVLPARTRAAISGVDVKPRALGGICTACRRPPGNSG